MPMVLSLSPYLTPPCLRLDDTLGPAVAVCGYRKGGHYELNATENGRNVTLWKAKDSFAHRLRAWRPPGVDRGGRGTRVVARPSVSASMVSAGKTDKHSPHKRIFEVLLRCSIAHAPCWAWNRSLWPRGVLRPRMFQTQLRTSCWAPTSSQLREWREASSAFAAGHQLQELVLQATSCFGGWLPHLMDARRWHH
jgi:hypothetical protein